jgi:DNA-directed RNA polymerase specialized sigma24 family protein
MAGIDRVVGDEPTPAFALEVADEFRRLLDLLDDDGLRQIALLKMEGYTVDEIAAQLGCARRAVERRLQLIRKIWSEAPPAEGTVP